MGGGYLILLVVAEDIAPLKGIANSAQEQQFHVGL